MIRSRWMYLSPLGLIIAGIPTLAAAQDSAVASVLATAGSVEDIVVTAQRRPERLQDVPVSVTALPADMMTKQRIINAAILRMWYRTCSR